MSNYKLYKQEGKLKEDRSKCGYYNSKYADNNCDKDDCTCLAYREEYLVDPDDWKDFEEGAEVKEFVLQHQWRHGDGWQSCSNADYDRTVKPNRRIIARPSVKPLPASAPKTDDKVAELMTTRYKVIAGYPEMHEHEIKVGQILQDTIQRPLITATLEQYPHLFKKLEWWEDITIMDLPDYIKWTSPGQDKVSIFKINNWYSSPNSFDIAGCDVDGARLFIKDCLPATKEEYLQSLTNR